MKILYYNLQLGSFDGSNMHALGMLNSLKTLCGDENVLVANEYSKATYNHAVGTLKRKFSKSLKPLRIIRREIISSKNNHEIVKKIKEKGFSPDYILARSVLYDKTPIRLAEALKCKLIVEHNTPFVYECCTLRKTETERTVRKYEKLLLAKANGIYVVSEILRQMMIEDYSFINPNKIKTVPNGFIKKLFEMSETQSEQIRNTVRAENGVEDKWVVTFVGSLQEWHGINKLIDTARIMQNEKNVQFWVLGDGAKRDEVQAYTHTNENMKWFGNVPFEKLRDLLFASDLGIMPYEEIEQFYFSPLKMFDMIGAGLPFIGLKIGQIDEICSAHLNQHFLISQATPKNLAQDIQNIKSDPRLYNQMKRSVLNIREKHTWDVRAKELVQWIELI